MPRSQNNDVFRPNGTVECPTHARHPKAPDLRGSPEYSGPQTLLWIGSRRFVSIRLGCHQAINPSLFSTQRSENNVAIYFLKCISIWCSASIVHSFSDNRQDTKFLKRIFCCCYKGKVYVKYRHNCSGFFT